MVKIDVEASGKWLHGLFSEPIRRSPYEDLEPDYEFMNSVCG